ncbi:unnamed protein product [Parnassius apollo]|uniref:Cilia- and flagella-associated protein 157 n=1 Tax=Parnassius apollo TaxID=110799 RepID=A0A8S3W1G7_PARAO|nr:unnamed protein product [Parnassius apollo]
MEARLLQLAQDFQDATELRIAASTHRVIRENIAINNELDNILSTQSKLAEQNDKYKESERSARIKMELAEEERDKAINKSIVQQKVIDQLTLAFQNINKEKALFEKRNYDFEALQAKVQKLTKENENLSLQVRILEQNLHAKLTDQNKSVVESSKISKENAKLKQILKEAATAVLAALKLDQWSTVDPTRDVVDRQVLLSRLLMIITQYRDIQQAGSMETLASFEKIYEGGDLGFIPKPSSKKSIGSTVILASSKDSFHEEKESLTSKEISIPSIGSIKTIPSMKLVPPSSEPEMPIKESIQSFVTSSQSTEGSVLTESEESETDTIDIEKQLEISKLEIQKSIMKDLAYSQMALQSQSRFSEEREKGLISKSVIFESTENEKKKEDDVEESREKLEREQEASDDRNSEQIEVKDEEESSDDPKQKEKEDGQAVELAACECTARPWAGDSSVVVAEVGARCRCGCVLHLAPAARLLAGSARACPARSFWLLQAEEGLVVRLRFEAVRLPCAGQALRARDGDSLGSPLLASWDGPDSTASTGDVETTTDGTGVIEIAGGRHILVELKSADTSERCTGGFLAHAYQIEPIRNASAAWASVGGGAWWRGGGGARAAAGALAALAALAALGLALHSAHRTRAYQRAADKESLTDSDACSASLELGVTAAASRSTLLSDGVGSVALRRLRPTARHSRLREPDPTTNRDEEDQGTDVEVEPGDTISVASAESVASQATITPETVSSSSAPVGSKSITSSPLRRSHTVSTSHVSSSQATSPPQPSASKAETIEMNTSNTSVSERGDSMGEKDRDSAWEKDRSESRASSSTSAATLTNGWYSPALSGVSSARIRDNPKYTKETCNRKLLKSDLSLTSHPEMEIDYYDYEVNNAGSVPGSYLGMDPAFLVWIPPIEDGDIIKEIDENKSLKYEEVIPKELRPDPGSNTESPEDRPPSSTLRRNADNRTNRSNESIKSMRKVMDRGNIIHPLNFSISDLQHSPRVTKKNKRKREENPVSIPMKDLTLNMSPVRVHRSETKNDYDNSSTLKRVNDTSRETKDDTLKRTDAVDLRFADENSDSSNDIKFADDSPDSNRLVDRYEVIA